MTTMTTTEAKSSQSGRTLAAVVTFLMIFIVLMVIALLNAPTMGGPRVMASAATYLQEVQRTALPFLGFVALVAIVVGLIYARAVYRVWPNRRRRQTMIVGYLFLA